MDDSSQHYYLPEYKFLTPGNAVLISIMAIGVMAAIYRFSQGLGAVTNLSDQYPWGLWVAFDVVCGVALAAGGFTTAAVVYIFWGEEYHGLVRPAVLTGFLGYVFVAVGLIADLGIPWHIWHPIIFWPEHSALFEVAWCVMLYLSVLALEFMPSVFERFRWYKLQEWFNRLVPVYIVLALSFFTYIMSHSYVWAGSALVVLTLLALFLPRLIRDKRGVPILLIISGILFSTAHQSSLGTLFLLSPDKLHHLWWTPMLPVNFFLSAAAVGFAMVIFESTLAARNYGLPIENHALNGLARWLTGALLIYFIVRIGDIFLQGQAPLFISSMGLLLAAELLIGVIGPGAILLTTRLRQDWRFRLAAATLVIIGLIFNRFNVTLLAMKRFGTGWYFPSLSEIVISMAIVSGILFFYNMMVRMFPVLPRDEEHGPTAPADEALRES